MEWHLRRGRIALCLYARWLGADLCLTLSGGQREHVGAVAVAIPRPSHSGHGRSATASVFTLPGHMEDLLARRLALRLAAALDTTVCLTCGIHLERAAREELEEVERMADDLANSLIQAFPFAAADATRRP